MSDDDLDEVEPELDEEALDEDELEDEDIEDEGIEDEDLAIDDDTAADAAPAPDVDERGEGPARIVPRRPGEFLCASCFLVLPRSQLADAKRMLCRDCA